jgi:hypothetical protein
MAFGTHAQAALARLIHSRSKRKLGVIEGDHFAPDWRPRGTAPPPHAIQGVIVTGQVIELSSGNTRGLEPERQGQRTDNG